MSAGDAEQRQRLEQFAATKGRGRVYASVPVSGVEAGWPAGTPVHVVDAVWLDAGGAGDIVDWSPSIRGEFTDVVANSNAMLVSPRGYADRTAFGMLIAGRELFSRAYPDHRRIDALCVSDRLRGMSIAYLADGIPVQDPEGINLPNASHRGPRLRGEPETPTGEDALVHRFYEDSCANRGTLWQEVPVSDAALDGLYLADRDGALGWWSGDENTGLVDALSVYDAEVIEAKRRMNADVIGQVVAGASLLAHAYPNHRLIRQTVVVGGEPDPALDWVCAKRGIRVVRFENQ